jgi:formylglycine-generating enzyme required for sulfatase activity
VLDHLQEAGTRLNLVFLDACRDNPFAGGRSFARGLARVTPSGKGETLISYSTSEGNVAADDSLYSPALTRLIKEQPTQPIQMLLTQVGAEVKQKSNDTQHPDYTTSVTTTFCFGGCQQVAALVAPVTPAAAPVAVSPAPVIAPSPAPAAPSRPAFEPEMVTIRPADSFTMGCQAGRDDEAGGCYDNEKPAHPVRLNAYQIGKDEVTFEQWDECEREKACPHAADEGWGRGKRPVINVSWNDITQHYIPWLNRKTGKEYRLPSEAEWEYAARGGTETAYPWGNRIGKGKANCDNSSCGDKFEYTAPVGRFAANGYGLHDMQGNVWEWCQDWYGSDYYASSPASNPQGAGSGTDRVLRGGSWRNDAQDVRSANRFDLTPGYRNYDIGFRLVVP